MPHDENVISLWHGSMTFMSWPHPDVHQNLSMKMVENLHQIIVLSPQKDNPQGRVGIQHKFTTISHSLVDEKGM